MDDILSKMPVAAPWSLWLGTLGKGFIIGAFILFAAAIGLWAFAPRNEKLDGFARKSFNLGAAFIFGAFGCLLVLFLSNQFQYEYVFEHGDATTDLKYKIAGVWTAQQGSFLLWACTSALFAALSLIRAGKYRRWMGITYSGFLACLAAILSYETPFNIIRDAMAHGKVYVPPMGAGMTPALQNYWVVIHPPIIFMGFGSLVVMFGFAVAAMMTGDVRGWARLARPWALISLAVLGLGLCLGGLWAYETQGWGGFWAWDPVENVSFVPWLFTAALIHGLIVQVTKGKWLGSNLWLAGLPFLTFVYGTFLTRSGLLDKVSVHSFASMDQSALVILRSFLIAVTLAFVGIYIFKGRKAAAALSKPQTEEPGLHREGFYTFGATMISLLSAGIAVGMSWPWISALLKGGEVSRVEEGLYHRVVVWFFIPLMFMMAVAPFVGWRSLGWREVGNRILNVASLAIGATGFAYLMLANPSVGAHVPAGARIAFPFGFSVPELPWIVFLLALCLFVAIANLWRAVEIFRRSKTGIGGFVAHIGLATLMAGLILSRGLEQKEEIDVPVNGSAEALGYQVSFKSMDGSEAALHDRSHRVFFDVVSPSGTKFEAEPVYYVVRQGDKDTPVVWPHIERQPSHDIYFSMAPPIIELWPEAKDLNVGETIDSDGVKVTYLSPTIEGGPGQVGTKFGAKLRIEHDGGSWIVHPTLKIGQGELEPDFPKAGPGLRATLLMVQPGTRKATLQLLADPILFPVTLFYKPMTILVWLGAGILALGGLIAAWSRRVTSGAAKLLQGASEPAPEPELDDKPTSASAA